MLTEKLKWMSQPALKLLTSYLTGGKQRVKWNDVISSQRLLRFGVRQGSVMGPLLFVLLTADLPRGVVGGLADEGRGVTAAATIFADDTSTFVSAPTWEEANSVMDDISANLSEYSRVNSLHLNKSKTQVIRLGHPESLDTLTLLGVTVNRNLGFASHHDEVLKDVRRRIGVVRTSISRGPLLAEAARALVIGRLQYCA